MTSKRAPHTAQVMLMPVRGLRSEQMREVGTGKRIFTEAAARRLSLEPSARTTRKPQMTIIHSMGETGPKLAEMGAEEVAAMRVSDPGVRAVPIIMYERARRPFLEVAKTVRRSNNLSASVNLDVRCVDKASQKPLAGVVLVVFTDYSQKIGAQGRSDRNGRILLDFGGASVKFEILAAYGPHGYWGIGIRGGSLKSGATLEFEPVDLAIPDYAAVLYSGASPDAGEGVKVGVVDTGVDDTHPDLTVVGSHAFVYPENDVGGGKPATHDGEHGTHVAGIIASTGSLHPQPPKKAKGKRGIAPKVSLYSYRVFPNAGGGATNYDIVRAIDQGVKDKCDFLNLSLGSEYADEAVEVAIKDAFDNGTVCIVAAGNDGRAPVSYPAAWDISVAVSSSGKKGTYPATSSEILDEVAPFATTDPNVFISAFSNVGPAIDLTGPGQGIVSTIPGGGYGVMSGTSMSCPAVTGIAAALLSADSKIRNLPRDRNRSIAIVGMLSKAAVPLGFNPTWEGAGLLR